MGAVDDEGRVTRHLRAATAWETRLLRQLTLELLVCYLRHSLEVEALRPLTKNRVKVVGAAEVLEHGHQGVLKAIALDTHVVQPDVDPVFFSVAQEAQIVHLPGKDAKKEVAQVVDGVVHEVVREARPSWTTAALSEPFEAVAEGGDLVV